MVKSYNFKLTIHAGDGHSKPLRTVKSKHHVFGLADESSKTDVANSTQCTDTQGTSKLDDSWKNKQLPPIPGLHLRKVQRNCAVSRYPPIEDSERISTPWHTQTHRQQLYPQPVQQSSSGIKYGSHPGDSAISLPRSLIPVRRPPADGSLAQFTPSAGSSMPVHQPRLYAHPR
jgi:hypothetical protein